MPGFIVSNRRGKCYNVRRRRRRRGKSRCARASSLTHTHTRTRSHLRVWFLPRGWTWWLAASMICHRELAGRYARQSMSDGARPSAFATALPARRSYLVLSVRWATRITPVNCASLRRCPVLVGSSTQEEGAVSRRLSRLEERCTVQRREIPANERRDEAGMRDVAARHSHTALLTHKNIHTDSQTFSRGERKCDVRTSTPNCTRPMLRPDWGFPHARSPLSRGQELFARELTTRRPCYTHAPDTKRALLRNSRNGASVLIFGRFPFQ